MNDYQTDHFAKLQDAQNDFLNATVSQYGEVEVLEQPGKQKRNTHVQARGESSSRNGGLA